MKKVTAVLIVALAVSSSLAYAQSQTETEIIETIRASYDYNNMNNKEAPGTYSQHGAQEFFSPGGVLREFTQVSPQAEFTAYNIQPKDIRVIILVEGQVAVAHFYAEGSITFQNGVSISDYHTRVTRVFVKEGEQWKVRASHFSAFEVAAIVAVFDGSDQTTEQYSKIVQALDAAGAGNPEGRLYHAAYPKEGGGYMVVDVWESKKLLDKFSETLVPIIEDLGAVPAQPEISPVLNIISGAGGNGTTQENEAIVAVFDGSDETTEQYRAVINELDVAGAGNPEGRLYHAASPHVGGGYMVVDVWESKKLLDKFSETLVPIIDETGATPVAPQVFPVLNIIDGAGATQENEAVLQVTTDSNEAEDHFWKGVYDAENIFFTRSATHFEEALKLDSDFAMAHFMHASVVPGLNQTQRLEKMDEALADLATASNGELLFAMALREQVRGNTEERRALLESAAEMLPDDPHIAFQHAGTVGAGGSPERVAAWRRVTEQFPDHAAAHNSLAYLLWFRGDEAGARAAVKKYLELASDHPNSHDSYAELFQFSGMYNEAATHYGHAIELDSSYSAGYTGLAEAYLLMGDADTARDYLVQGEPHAATSGARANLKRAEANTYLMEGDTEEAKNKLKIAAEWAEKNEVNGLAAQAYRELAVAEAMFGDSDRVQEYLDKAVEIQGENVGHHAWSALAHGMASDEEATRKAADALKEAGGGSALVNTYDGLALLVAGDHKAAETALMQSGLQSMLSRALMARCQHEMGPQHQAEARTFKESVLMESQFVVNNLLFSFARLSLPEE